MVVNVLYITTTDWRCLQIPLADCIDTVRRFIFAANNLIFSVAKNVVLMNGRLVGFLDTNLISGLSWTVFDDPLVKLQHIFWTTGSSPHHFAPTDLFLEGQYSPFISVCPNPSMQSLGIQCQFLLCPIIDLIPCKWPAVCHFWKSPYVDYNLQY